MAARTGLLDQLRDPPGLWRRDPDTITAPVLPATIERSAHPALKILLPVAAVAPIPVFAVVLLMPQEPGAPSLYHSIFADAPEMLAVLAAVLLVESLMLLWMLAAVLRVRRYTVDRLQVSCEVRGPLGRRQWQEMLSRYTAIGLERIRMKGGSLHIVRLEHPQPDRRVPLVVTRSKEAARRLQAQWAAALRLPAEDAR